MDIATLLGLIVGIGVVTLAIWTGSDLSIFLNLPGFLIVIGGTFAATVMKFPINNVFVAFAVGVKAAFVERKEDPRQLIDMTLRMIKRARKTGILALERVRIPNPFFRKGVRLVVDGRDIDSIRKLLNRDMELTAQRQEVGERVFRAIGEAAPAFGMVGTLVGLVQMLANLNDPTAIGPAMAVALLTTLYGVLLAHLVALPIADKLEEKNQSELDTRRLIIEAVVQIHMRNNPTAAREVLEAFLPEKLRGNRAARRRPSPPDDGGRYSRRASDPNPATIKYGRRTADRPGGAGGGGLHE